MGCQHSREGDYDEDSPTKPAANANQRKLSRLQHHGSSNVLVEAVSPRKHTLGAHASSHRGSIFVSKLFNHDKDLLSVDSDEHKRICIILKKSVFAVILTPGQLYQFARYWRVEVHKPQTVLYEQDGLLDKCYFIEKGTVSCDVQRNGIAAPQPHRPSLISPSPKNANGIATAASPAPATLSRWQQLHKQRPSLSAAPSNDRMEAAPIPTSQSYEASTDTPKSGEKLAFMRSKRYSFLSVDPKRGSMLKQAESSSGTKSPKSASAKVCPSPTVTARGGHRRNSSKLSLVVQQTSASDITVQTPATPTTNGSMTHLTLKRSGDMLGVDLFVMCASTTKTQQPQYTHNHTATVQGISHTTVVTITKQAYQKCLLKLAEACYVLKQHFDAPLHETLSDITPFQSLTHEQLRYLAVTCNYRTLTKDDEPICVEGYVNREIGASLYVLLSGKLDVISSSETADANVAVTDNFTAVPPTPTAASAQTNTAEASKPVVAATLSAPLTFGEVSLLLDIPRTTTMMLHTSTPKFSNALLLEIQQADFRAITHYQTGLAPQLLTLMSGNVKTYMRVALKYFLHSPLFVEYFTNHCTKEFSRENLDCFMEMKTFGSTDVPQDQLQIAALNIVDTYIRQDAAHQVNISALQRSQIMQKVQDSVFTLNMFDKACNELLKLMSQDSFRRFRDSDMFVECIEALNSPHIAAMRKMYLL